MTAATRESWGRQWLPTWPLASDDLSLGLRREARERALDRLWIETNPSALLNVIVVDIDHSNAIAKALDGNISCRPNLLVENPENGHAHALWFLDEPVTRTEYARRKPLAYATAVVEGLRRATCGDAGYSGLITKNPVHDRWLTMLIHENRYSLDELRTALDELGCMPPANWARTRRKNPVGLGRNCAIFETARHWAYREIRRHWSDPKGLERAINAQVMMLNAEFSEPLGEKEAAGIARSISRWIITQSRMWRDGQAVYEATFSAMQSARRKRQGAVTRKRIEEAVGGQ